jgi:tetratricopeptide (TPR) repeat protein
MAFARHYSSSQRRLVCVLFPLFWSLATHADTSQPAGLAEARKDYFEAQAKFKASPTNTSTAWEFGRAAFDLAEFATNKTERAQIAEQGISACRTALQQDAKSAAAHYYLGLNLGQMARTRGLSALRLIKEMETEWKTAATLDPKFDFGGPHRSLGLLYRDAPSFGSIGSRPKAREHLAKAIELAPNYPENRLELIESCLDWGDRNGARRELKALESIWPVAQKELQGPLWDKNAANWEAQLQKFKTKIEEPAKIETPRH